MASWTEEEMDVRMGRVLRWGVLTAALVMAAGGVLYLLHNGKTVPDYRRFQPGNSTFWSPSQMKRSDGSGVIELAVLLIVATPIARVIFAAYGFARLRDWLYVAISMIVLVLLLFSVAHSA